MIQGNIIQPKIIDSKLLIIFFFFTFYMTSVNILQTKLPWLGILSSHGNSNLSQSLYHFIWLLAVSFYLTLYPDIININQNNVNFTRSTFTRLCLHFSWSLINGTWGSPWTWPIVSISLYALKWVLDGSLSLFSDTFPLQLEGSIRPVMQNSGIWEVHVQSKQNSTWIGTF